MHFSVRIHQSSGDFLGFLMADVFVAKVNLKDTILKFKATILDHFIIIFFRHRVGDGAGQWISMCRDRPPSCVGVVAGIAF